MATPVSDSGARRIRRTVHVEEDDRREQSSPPVPVDERVVLHDVKEIGRRHRERPLVRELAIDSGSGGSSPSRSTRTTSACSEPRAHSSGSTTP